MFVSIAARPTERQKTPGQVRFAQTQELLRDWQVDPPARWTVRVNAAETTVELDQLRLAVARAKPFGNPTWTRPGRSARSHC